MEHYLKLSENGVAYGTKQDDSDDIIYDDKISFNDLDEGIEWIYKKFGVEKREIQYIHQLDI